jgi:CubicO group peptidase (beta-lactamase class C family)
MELHNIPGLALAVIKNDKVIYENYFGKASIENDSPVDKSTLFRIFSATKLITATGIFQLIQDGKLNLEDKISKYLNDLPDHWQNIRVKNLLSHSSGLPDIVRHKSTLSDKELLDKLAEDKMEFVTGNQFRYNQTNFWFLGKIIEKITGMTFDEFVLKNQFDNATNGILFSSNSQETIPNRAIRYIYNGKTKEFEKGTSNSGKRGFSGNGLNITLDKFTEWNKLLDSNQLLDEQTKYKMWTPFKFSNKKDTFLYGWGIYPVNKINSFGFSGGNLAAFRKFENHNTTIILLSNGNKIPAHDIIVNDIARIVIPEIKASILEEDIMNFVISNQYDKALTSFKKFKAENPNSNFKWDINNLGNIYLYDENNTEKAFQVFKFNAEANPDWWVSLAGLAEIYEIQKDSLKAIEHYKKAIILNKNNELNYNEQMKNKIEELKTN